MGGKVDQQVVGSTQYLHLAHLQDIQHAPTRLPEKVVARFPYLIRILPVQNVIDAKEAFQLHTRPVEQGIADGIREQGSPRVIPFLARDAGAGDYLLINAGYAHHTVLIGVGANPKFRQVAETVIHSQLLRIEVIVEIYDRKRRGHFVIKLPCHIRCQ